MDKNTTKVSKIQNLIIVSAIILFVLLLTFVLLRKLIDWPNIDSEKTVLIGIFIFSLLPFVIKIIEIIVERGGKIEIGNVKIDFSKVQGQGIADFTVPANIGVRGQPVTDSNTTNIIDTLKQATVNSTVVVDLEDGKAWWETRLLVLLSGAQRIGRPDKIVFTSTKSEQKEYFIGWANPNDLLKYLLKENPKYAQSYYVAKAVSAQWNLAERPWPNQQQGFPNPVALPWMQPEASSKSWMILDPNTNLPNEMFEEQVLQNELGREVETTEGGKLIGFGRVSILFGNVLHTNYIDQNDTSEQQLRNFYANDLPYIPLTRNGKYISLVSRLAVYNEILKKLTEKKEE